MGELLRIRPAHVLVASTGVIGVPLPMEKIRTAMPGLVKALSPQGGRSANEAILTTDTRTKEAAARVEIGFQRLKVKARNVLIGHHRATGAGQSGRDAVACRADQPPTKEGRMRRMTWLAVFVALAVTGAWMAAPALSQSKVVKIGDLGSKVGVFEGYGKYQTMGVQMAVEELNAKGGVLGHKMEIVSEDDETKPAPAVRKAEKRILQDDGKQVEGAVSRGPTMAVMDVTKKHKTIHWNSVSCAEFMRTTKFHKYYFSNQPDSRMQANGLAKYILDKMGKKVYIFYTDYAMGQSDGRQFKTAFEKLGGEVVGVAGAGKEHLAVLNRIAQVFVDSDQVARLRAAVTPQEVVEVLSDGTRE